jgi:hypothetical protein
VKIAAIVPCVVVVAAGCAHVDVKGRETFRVGPLRGVPIAAVDVVPKVVVDAGSDALTDDELAKVESELPQALSASFDRLAHDRNARRVGTARVDGCRLDAGRAKTGTLYAARCKVALVVDEVGVVEVHAEALVTNVDVFGRPTGEGAGVNGRNPALSADDAERALAAALDAAAVLVVDGELPIVEDETRAQQAAPMPRAQRAELARARLRAGGDAKAALFDIRSAGTPSDADSVLPFLDNNDDGVKSAAVDALGELCSPSTTERVKLVHDGAESDTLKHAADRALLRLAACAKLASAN